MRGHLSPWLFAECERCGAILDVSDSSNRIKATQALFRVGWRTLRISGLWVCGDCKPKMGPIENKG